jgi:hypothetical protein
MTPDKATLRAAARAYRDAWGAQVGEPSEWWWEQCEKGLLAAFAVLTPPFTGEAQP